MVIGVSVSVVIAVIIAGGGGGIIIIVVMVQRDKKKKKVGGIHMCIHTHTHTHTHVRAHMHAHTHTCTHAHACTHTHTHARTHAHTPSLYFNYDLFLFMPVCILCIQHSEVFQMPMLPVNPQEGELEKPHCNGETTLNATGSTSTLLRSEEPEAGRHAAQRQHYAELDFADRRPIPAPPSGTFVVAYAEVGQA